MSRKDFDEVPRWAVDEGLSATGESVEHPHFHAENSFAECVVAADSRFQQRNRIKTATELAE